MEEIKAEAPTCVDGICGYPAQTSVANKNVDIDAIVKMIVEKLNA